MSNRLFKFENPDIKEVALQEGRRAPEDEGGGKMKNKKSEKKTYAEPRKDELDDSRRRYLVGLGLFLCFTRALENNSTEEMEKILKELDEVGLTLKKTEGGDYILKEKEEK